MKKSSRQKEGPIANFPSEVVGDRFLSVRDNTGSVPADIADKSHLFG